MTIVAVIAAHPDDEVLGCGGTIAQHSQKGDEVHVLIMAEGATSREAIRDPARFSTSLSQLADAAEHANKLLGAHSVELLSLPDNRMDSLDRLDVIKIVETFFHKVQPEIVYTHHAGDVNIDHRRIHEAVVTASRPIPYRTVSTLLFFEVASSTEWQPSVSGPSFIPNWYSNISDTLELKLDALRVYHSEMRPFPHARSIEAVEHLARWRGATIGLIAAEAFMLGRNIVYMGNDE